MEVTSVEVCGGGRLWMWGSVEVMECEGGRWRSVEVGV